MRDWFLRTGRFAGTGLSAGIDRFAGIVRGHIGDQARSVRRLWAAHPRSVLAAALAVLLAGSVGLIVGLSGSGHQTGDAAGAAAAAPPVSPVPVSAQEFAKLPRATTFSRISTAPLDQDPFAVTEGLVLHSPKPQVLYVGPGRQPIGVLPVTELGSPTWVPVVQTSPGWDRVLLPSRPNRATGWIYTAGNGGSDLQVRRSSYVIRIQTSARKLSVDEGGGSLGTWTVAVGAPGTPTPTGRTFLLSLLAPPHPTYSPLILPLGFHSNVLSTFGGGPGTVGLHGWPNPSVFGHAVSNGCVRVPADALNVLSGLPLGTLVLITQ